MMAIQFSKQGNGLMYRLDDCVDYVKVAIEATSQIDDDGSHSPLNTQLKLIAKELRSISLSLDEMFFNMKKEQADDCNQ